MISTRSSNRLRKAWANLNPWLRGLVLIWLGGLVALGFVPVYCGMQSWWVERSLDEAQAAVSNERLEQARELSQTLVQSGDSRIDALRILNQSMALGGDVQHINISHALLSHPEGSDADRFEGFRGLCKSVALGLLNQAWVALPENCRENPAFAALYADRLMADGHVAEAASILLRVPEKGRDEALQTRLIRNLILTGKDEALREAQVRIARRWISNGNQQSLIALLEDIPIPSLDPRLLSAVRATLPDPGAGNSGRLALMAARIDIAAEPLGMASMNESMMFRWRDEAPSDLARFLRALKLHFELNEVFDRERISRTMELMPLVLDSCERCGDWTAVGRLLNAFPQGVPKSEWLAHRAMALYGNGKSVRGLEAWNAAILEAKFAGTCEPYFRLRSIAEAAGRGEEADQAFLEGLLTGRGPLPLYSDLELLLDRLASKERENALLRIHMIYLPFEPTNFALLSQCSYLGCMNDLIAPQDVCGAVEPIALAYPEERRFGFVLAAARLCQGNPGGAAAVLDSMKFDPLAISPGFRAVFLASRVLNGQLDPKNRMILDFSWESLLPSERRKFRKWIRSASKDDATW